MGAPHPETGADPDAMDFLWEGLNGLSRSYWATAPDDNREPPSRGDNGPVPKEKKPRDMLKEANDTVKRLAKSAGAAKETWRVVTSLLTTQGEAPLNALRTSPTTQEIIQAAREGAREGARRPSPLRNPPVS
jgi:hypothetical protein